MSIINSFDAGAERERAINVKLPYSILTLSNYQFHYRTFNTTTSCSAPVPCFGTLILMVSATWISPLASRRLVPVVPWESPKQSHATSSRGHTASSQ